MISIARMRDIRNCCDSPATEFHAGIPGIRRDFATNELVVQDLETEHGSQDDIQLFSEQGFLRGQLPDPTEDAHALPVQETGITEGAGTQPMIK